jgi:DNA-binding MarR family transcriptional regulator
MARHENPQQIDVAALCASVADDDAVQSWRQMAHTFLKLQRVLEEMLVPYGLAMSQFEALAKVGMNPGVIQQDLVKYLLVTKGNVGALVDRLEEAGLIERRPDPTDRRANRLFVTHKGAGIVAEVFGKHCVLVHEMFSPLNSAQRKTLQSLLKAIEPT